MRPVGTVLVAVTSVTIMGGVPGCGDRPLVPTRDWPQPAEITRPIDHNCILIEGAARCWGYAPPPGFAYDEADELMLMLRDALFPGSPLPTLDLGESTDVTSLAKGRGSRCAVLEGRGVKCWGDNLGFALGQPEPTLRLGDDPGERGPALPFIDLGTTASIVQVEALWTGFFVLDERGRIKGWGGDAVTPGLEEAGVRGDEPNDMGDALPFVDLGTDFVAVGLSVGAGSACAWTSSGALKCWGNNDNGELGIDPVGTMIGDEPGEMGDALPFVDLGRDVVVVQVATDLFSTCALTDDGRVKCWGAAEAPTEGDGPAPAPPSIAPLGQGDDLPRVPPLGDALPYVDLGSDAHVVAIDLEDGVACALLDTGRLKCWGINNLGQLGQEDAEYRGDDPGEMGDALRPIDLGRGRTVVAFSAGFTPCARLDDDSVKCWGRLTGAGGEPGTMGDALVPVARAEDLGLGR